MTFSQGTRSALYSNDRESITVTVQEVTPRSVGAMIALYERAVGIYASLVNINAYHQPGKMPISFHCHLEFGGPAENCCVGPCYICSERHFVDMGNVLFTHRNQCLVIRRCGSREKGSRRSTSSTKAGSFGPQ